MESKKESNIRSIFKRVFQAFQIQFKRLKMSLHKYLSQMKQKRQQNQSLYNPTTMSSIKPSHNNTYQRCQKILRLFSQIDTEPSNKKPQARPTSSSANKSTPYYISRSSNKHSSNFMRNNNSISKLKNNLNVTNQQFHSRTGKSNLKESSMFREKSNTSFVSCYKKESRLEQIMKLKVSKPKIQSMARLNSNKKALLLNSSFSSLNSSRSSLNKENINQNSRKESRLEKIMNIKVQKPKVNSTLLGYEPKKCERSASKSLSKKNSFFAESNSVLELKECKKKMQKSYQIQEKEERLWKTFEREREMQMKEKKRQEEENYKNQRRKEQKFEKLVYKEMKKIQNSRQISLRKDKTFSPYVYPSY